jgi:hypothetical protein
MSKDALGGHTILVVEDEPLIALDIARVLRSQPWARRPAELLADYWIDGFLDANCRDPPIGA